MHFCGRTQKRELWGAWILLGLTCKFEPTKGATAGSAREAAKAVGTDAEKVEAVCKNYLYAKPYLKETKLKERLDKPKLLDTVENVFQYRKYLKDTLGTLEFIEPFYHILLKDIEGISEDVRKKADQNLRACWNTSYGVVVRGLILVIGLLDLKFNNLNHGY